MLAHDDIPLMQVLQQAESGHAKAHQSGSEQKKSEASMVLQLARWTAETGEGAKADIKGDCRWAQGLPKSMALCS